MYASLRTRTSECTQVLNSSLITLRSSFSWCKGTTLERRKQTPSLAFTICLPLIHDTFTFNKNLNFRMWFKNGLKAQKLLAQGSALGMMANSKTPCKGKSFMFCLEF